jgi:hypothetical protein
VTRNEAIQASEANRMQIIHLGQARNGPLCSSLSLQCAAPQGFAERIWFRFAFAWPYRCDDCDSRFWGFYLSLAN